jgi:hypothetical protein
VRHDDTDHEHIHVAINKIHPETFRIHSPAWDHQKLFTGARALERELGLRPLRWARENLRPALRRSELRRWDDVHEACGRLGVVIRSHGNGLVFEDVTRGVRVKASCVGRELSKARLCEHLGPFQPASERQLKAARQAPHRARVGLAARSRTGDRNSVVRFENTIGRAPVGVTVAGSRCDMLVSAMCAIPGRSGVVDAIESRAVRTVWGMLRAIVRQSTLCRAVDCTR